ncbi:hypothetical protein [Shewanella aestuarii]|uniref:Uncharacterized protein n=1 Tax=Shewanella aestuarii TaxID=1028752 RepID=A0A6G9QPF2_9GAMM|nr:hypothetical protein [Shewanella aestuarii]QIR16446.1 hypothetical protein HBH39_18415 [Shewanella aestuarii]
MSENKVFNAVQVIMFLLSVVVISSLVTRFQIQSTEERIDYLSANKISVQVLDQDAVLGLFTTENYDIQTQYEYLDLLKILLKANNIILLDSSALKFKDSVSTLAIHPIEALRQGVNDLGIENPRIANAEEYAEREKNQRIIMDSLMNNVMPNIPR